MTICDVAYNILKEHGKNPMFFRDITAKVQETGIIIPSDKPEHYVLYQMLKDGRFIRPHRRRDGKYTLREFILKVDE